MKQLMMILSVIACYLTIIGCEGSLGQDFADPTNLVADPILSEYDQTAERVEAGSTDTGVMVFWTRLPGIVADPAYRFTPIEITVTRKYARYEVTGMITTPWADQSAPGCAGDIGCANFNLPIGSYYYAARDHNGEILTGELEVRAGDCNQVYVPLTTIGPSPTKNVQTD